MSALCPFPQSSFYELGWPCVRTGHQVKWMIPLKICWLLVHSPFSLPDLLVTLLLGKRLRRENPTGSLRTLEQKGGLWVHWPSLFFWHRRKLSPQEGNLLMGRPYSRNQTPRPKPEADPYTSSTYLELWKLLDGTGGHACPVFADFFLTNWPQVFYLAPLKNIWDTIILEWYRGICSDDRKIIAYLAKGSAGVLLCSLETPLPKPFCQNLSSHIQNLNLGWKAALKNVKAACKTALCRRAIKTVFLPHLWLM